MSEMAIFLLFSKKKPGVHINHNFPSFSHCFFVNIEYGEITFFTLENNLATIINGGWLGGWGYFEIFLLGRKFLIK
jgi:hypothetical protein